MPAMAKTNVWVVNHGDGWPVKREGSDDIVSEHTTQEAAIDAARPLARDEGVELIWQGADGEIQGRDSHGSDPPEIEG